MSEHETTKRGGFRHIRLGVLLAEKPAEVAKQIRTAWAETGSADAAAERLEISVATFWRYVARLSDAGHDPRPRDAQGEPPKRGGRTGARVKRSTSRARKTVVRA